MIEPLKDFPENIIAFVCKGQVTKADYDTVLVPAVEKALKNHDKIRLYYELGVDFAGIDPGAMWEDFKVGVGHWLRWGQIAVVTDVDWLKYSINAFGFLMLARIRFFPVAQASETRQWITA